MLRSFSNFSVNIIHNTDIKELPYEITQYQIQILTSDNKQIMKFLCYQYKII